MTTRRKPTASAVGFFVFHARNSKILLEPPSAFVQNPQRPRGIRATFLESGREEDMTQFQRVALVVCAICCIAGPAPAAILTSNDVLRVRFNTTPGATPVPDVLSLHLGI